MPVKELGERMESVVKCPLQSREISVQKNTEVSNGEGKKKTTKITSILGMRLHAWSIWWVAFACPFVPEIATK